MSDPLRPQHSVSRREQLRAWRSRTLERLRMAMARTATTDQGTSDMATPSAISSMVPGLLVGAVVALLGLGALWGWQTWSGRVSVPIDDRLPLLIPAADAAAPADSDTSVPTSVPAPAANFGASEPSAVDPTSDGAVVVPAEPTAVVVHVAGAVMVPGVVMLEAGERVVDALEAAGGPSADADLDRVNLAALVIDGERIHVPAKGEDEPPQVVAPSRPAQVATSSETVAGEAPELVVDINAATADELEALPGVGPSIAAAIVQTRVDRGPFLAVDELLEVPGIGEAKLAQIEPHVRVG